MPFHRQLFRPMLGPEGKGGGGESGGAKSEPATGGTLVLTLDDVLARVPTRSLKPGLHDPSRELHFAMDELLDGISRGRATIALSKLAERYPDTFQMPTPGGEDTAIFLPLQKLIQQIGRASKRAPEKLVLPPLEPPPGVPAPVMKASEPVAVPAAPPAAVAPPAAAPAPEPAPAKPLRKLMVMQDPVEGLPHSEPEPIPPVAPPPAAAPVAYRPLSEPPPYSPPPAPAPPPSPPPAPVPPPVAVAPPVAAPAAEVKPPPAPEPVAVESVAADLPPDLEPPLTLVSETKLTEAAADEPKLAEEQAPPVSLTETKPPVASVPPPTPPAAEAAPRVEGPPPITPPPLPVRPPQETRATGPALPKLFTSSPPPESKVVPPPAAAPAPQSEPAPEVPHSPVLGNPPANLETAARIPGRPIVRPPSLQGPAGPVNPAAATPATPAMPGFVFAPRQSAPLSDFTQPAFSPEMESPGIHIPPLFPSHAPSPLPEKPAPSSVDPEPESAPVASAPPEPEPPPEPAVSAEIPPAPAPEPPVSEPSLAQLPSVEPAPPSSEPAPAEPVAEKPTLEPAAGPNPAPLPVELEKPSAEEKERQLSPARGEAAARANELLGTHFSLARIDQEPLQAIFMTEEFLDLSRVSQLSCSFPGITGCMIVAGDALAHGGERPAGLDAQALCQLTKQLSAVAVAFPDELPAVQTYTLHIGNRALSIFARPHVSLCLVHSHRGFLPGVRERLAAVADTLSRGLSGESEPR